MHVPQRKPLSSSRWRTTALSGLKNEQDGFAGGIAPPLVVGQGRCQRRPAGRDRGTVTGGAAALARDLANTPPGHLTARDLADLAVVVAERGRASTSRCSTRTSSSDGLRRPARRQRRAAPSRRAWCSSPTRRGKPTGHLGLVGKGIMYDSGGISLKPSDAMHATMKMDMSGAAAVLGDDDARCRR